MSTYTGGSAASKEPAFMQDETWLRSMRDDERKARLQQQEDDVYRSESRDTGATGGSGSE